MLENEYKAVVLILEKTLSSKDVKFGQCLYI